MQICFKQRYVAFEDGVHTDAVPSPRESPVCTGAKYQGPKLHFIEPVPAHRGTEDTINSFANCFKGKCQKNIIIITRIKSGNYPVLYYDTISNVGDTHRLSIANFSF